MRVFVAGATGAIGRPLIPKLVAAGHEVTGMTRSAERAAGLRDAGATPLVTDVFDEERVAAGMAAARPEVVIHQLTALPDKLNFRDKGLYEATNRVRGEGTRILLDAAHAVGARRLVAQSIAFAYAPVGESVVDEEAPLLSADDSTFGSVTATIKEMEGTVVGDEQLDGLVLRYGFFYGPGTYYAADGSSAEEVRKRRQPIVGEGTGVFSFIHVDDAADATIAALDHGSAGIYNVVDDEPAPLSEWVPVYAEAIGAKPPRRIPAWLARLVAGKAVAQFALELRGASNAKAKRELGWQPAHASWRQGFAQSVA